MTDHFSTILNSAGSCNKLQKFILTKLERVRYIENMNVCSTVNAKLIMMQILKITCHLTTIVAIVKSK